MTRFPVLEHPFPVFWFLLGKLFCPGMSRDRGVCPGIFAPALVLGQRDTGTRIFFCPGTKGQRDVPSRGNTSQNQFWSKSETQRNLLYFVNLEKIW